MFFFTNYDQQVRDYPLIIEDLSGVLTTGLPANPSSADLAAFSTGAATLRAKFPGGGPGHTIPRTNNQTLVLGKIDAVVTKSQMLSITYNFLYPAACGARATPATVVPGPRAGFGDREYGAWRLQVSLAS